MVMNEKICQIAPEEHQLSNGEKIFVGLLRPEDAEGVARLFRSVYGDGYPVRHFYDPDALIKAFDAGENYSLTARQAGGEVIGHVAMYRSSPYPNLYEAGAGLVLPEYRKEGVNKMLLSHLYETVAPVAGVDETWGEAVCNHVYMQRTVAQYRHVETGIEVDLMPAEAYVKEQSASGRVASMVTFRAYRSRPHNVFLPQAYERELRFLYSELDDQRKLVHSEEQLPMSGLSKASHQTFDFAGVVRLSFEEIGGDFSACLSALEEKLLSQKVRVAQLWLSLGCPWVGQTVDLAKSRGYFFGGLLPRWFDDDGMLMQKIIGRPDWEGIQLLSDRAREIFNFVKRDWESTV